MFKKSILSIVAIATLSTGVFAETETDGWDLKSISYYNVKEIKLKDKDIYTKGMFCNDSYALAQTAEGAEEAYNTLNGSINNTMLSQYAHKGYQTSTSWKNIVFAYSSFVCKLGQEDQLNLAYFLHGRARTAIFDKWMDSTQNTEAKSKAEVVENAREFNIDVAAITIDMLSQQPNSSSYYNSSLLNDKYFVEILADRHPGGYSHFIPEDSIHGDKEFQKFLGAIVKSDTEGALKIIRNSERVKKIKIGYKGDESWGRFNGMFSE